MDRQQKMKEREEKRIKALVDSLHNIKCPIIEFDKIKLGKELGKGNNTVYLGEIDSKPFAVKEVKMTVVMTDPKGFLKELYIHNIIQHERVPKLKGVCLTPNNTVYIIIDPIEDAKELHTKCKEESLKQKIDYLLQLVQIVADLHSKHILHRDLKPRNTLIKKNHEVWLIDFGLSKELSGSKTGTEDVKGTVYYMPYEAIEEINADCEEDEEQEEADGIDPQEQKIKAALEKLKPEDIKHQVGLEFDIFSLGAIISECVSGLNPWKNLNWDEIDLNKYKKGKTGLKKKLNIDESCVEQLLMWKVPFPVPKDIPEQVKKIVEKCTHVEKSERPKIDELVHLLKDYLNSLG